MSKQTATEHIYAEDSSALASENLQRGEVSAASGSHPLKRPARGDHILSWLFPLCFPVAAKLYFPSFFLRFRPGVCHTEYTLCITSRVFGISLSASFIVLSYCKYSLCW